MTDIATIRDAFATAELWQIIALSLRVSVSAAAIATVLGCSVASPWRSGGSPAARVAIVAANSVLGLSPLVIGLALYLLLSHTGLGWLGLLFTPTAMVIAQAVAGADDCDGARAPRRDLWAEYGDALLVFGASKSRAIPVLIDMGRVAMLTAAWPVSAGRSGPS